MEKRKKNIWNVFFKVLCYILGINISSHLIFFLKLIFRANSFTFKKSWYDLFD